MNEFVPFLKSDIEQTLVARFEKKVLRVPRKLAVKSHTHQLTYDSLNNFSNHIAHALLERDSDPQQRIALLFDQGAPLVASILGVLKSGSIYVPMNATDPPSRLEAIIREAQTTTLLTDKHRLSAATALMNGGMRVIDIDALQTESPATNPIPTSTPDSYAYIFFTSGTTGSPKGIVDTHRNVLHNVMRYTNSLRITESDRLSLVQAPAFSGSVSSLFCALLNGATLCPYDTKIHGIGKPLGRWVNEEQITMYHSVPAIFRSFLQDDMQCPSVRVIRLEGDAALMQDIELYKKHFAPACVLVNGLGATETGISRQFFVDHSTQLTGAVVPVGFSVEDMDTILLDENGSELGFNEVGEIAIRSDYLAAGYWNNPELTARSFSLDIGGRRTYRTGDLGLMRGDGCLEYLGRKDFQLKVKGNRIEPAEIESALLMIGGIKQAVVTTKTDASGEVRLVAYLVTEGHRPVFVRELREFLSGRLPEYMIPTRVVVLDELPVNAHLKIDRRLLPALNDAIRTRESQYVAPKTTEQATLVNIWETLFDTRPVGVDDDFFDLGGDSLAIAQLVVHIERRFGKELTPASIIQNPTVRRLAEILHTDRQQSLLVPLKASGTKSPFICIPAHDGNVLVYAQLARVLQTERPVYAIQPHGLNRHAEPLNSIVAIAAHNIKEMQSLQSRGPYFIGGFCLGGVVALEMAQQLSASGEKVELLALFDMNPGELPALVSEQALEKYGLYEHTKRQLHRKEQLTFGSFGNRISYLRRAVTSRAQKEGKRFIWNLARRSENGNTSVPRFLWDIQLSNDYAFKFYQPKYYPGKVMLLLAEQTTQSYSSNPAETWKNLAGEVETFFVPGEEGGMLKEPHVQTLARTLDAIL